VSGVHLDYTDEQRALRATLRDYFDDLLAALPAPGDDADPAAHRAWHREVVRRLGADGRLGLGWPREFGGHGRPWTEQYVFFDEAQSRQVPVPMISLNTVGPAIMRYGSPEQRADYLPKILSGEIQFSIGYTEPDAGTDLASLTTRAVRDGDTYVVNGAKIFTSGAELSDYIWLAVRTDPEAPRHRGLSILIVPTGDPGVTVLPLPTMGGRIRRTTQTFYSDVRVPASARVGAEGDGWTLITAQLNHERVAMAAAGGSSIGAFHRVCRWARSHPGPSGGTLADEPWVQQALGAAYARIEVMRLHNWRVAQAAGTGTLGAGEASVAKVYGTEAILDVTRSLRQVVSGGDRHLADELTHAYEAALVGTFGGGNNDIQRELIATKRLGLPRVPR
jgi:3-oxocholest-4-en-26-oyl-CoA dehydrogenase alpha subunit